MMDSLFQPLSLWLVLIVFLGSLLLTMTASAWFTRQLEIIGDLFDFSPGLLSLSGALGANIPNYVASIVSISHGQIAVGLGIIVGSNIYNVAIILSISTFALPALHGILLKPAEARDARTVALHTLVIMFTIWIALCLLSLPSSSTLQLSPLNVALLIVINILTLGIFAVLSRHALRRIPHDPYREHDASELPEMLTVQKTQNGAQSRTTLRVMGEMFLALLVALGGVIVMVSSGEDFATRVHMPPAILGLVILAVATSLPNTVVAFSLARAHQVAICVEEVLSSNSINAALGIALPLLFWHNGFHDPWLLFIDAPLMFILTLAVLLCVIRQKVSRPVALLLLLSYIVWVSAHLFL